MVQSAAQIAARLEVFRTETLASFEPVDKAKEAAHAEMNALLDSAVPPENLALPEVLITNTRAGLYIYVNSLVRSSLSPLDRDKLGRANVCDFCTDAARRSSPHGRHGHI